MEITKGLLYINDKDAAQEWGVFLTEKKEGEWTNYEALLKPSTTKELTVVDNPDADGEELPEEIELHLQARDVELYFCLWAESAQAYFVNYGRFFTMLRTGKAGWLEVRLPEIDRTFRLRYLGATDPDRRRRRVQQDAAEIQGAEASVLKRRLQGIQTTIKQR